MESFSMTAGLLTRRLAVLASLAAGLVLAACGGNDDPKDKKANANQASLRAINLSADVPSVDVYTGDTKRFSTLSSDTMSASATLEPASYTLAVKTAGQTATLFSESFTPAKGSAHTAVIAGRESGLLVRTIGESEDTAGIQAGTFRLRVLNLITDTATVDVYLVPTAAAVGGTPTMRFTGNTLSDFVSFPSATAHRVLVTAQGNANDIRLDIPLSGTADKQFHTLVLASTANGALVNASLIPQGGTAVALKNTRARVRLVAGGDANANVSASVAGTSIGGGLRSPHVGPYRLVEAGDRPLTVSVDGAVVATSTRTFAAGADYTVLAFGGSGARRVEVLPDDNRAPAAASHAKIRLVNAVDGSQPMSLRVDFQSLVTDVAPGTTSAYALVTGATSARLEV
ncbi:MAG TPA: DUF4397 domain-containing protein, partial [Rubrivivax sp.]|nr:DUF4397 domain-containing protein [Rubrivivax sp.]